MNLMNFNKFTMTITGSFGMVNVNIRPPGGAVQTEPDYDPSAYHPFAVTSDVAVFTLRGGRMHVLLVRRGEAPFAGQWALPGGFVRPDEDCEQSALRELAEETSIAAPLAAHLEQLRTYSAPNRDPRMGVVTVAYVALLPDLPEPRGATDAQAARWWALDDIVSEEMALAFDHAQILADAVGRVRSKLEYTTLATTFLPRAFTLGELRAVYTAVWGSAVDLQNFRRKVLGMPGFVEPLSETRVGVPGPPAQLYKAGPATEIVPPFTRSRMAPKSP